MNFLSRKVYDVHRERRHQRGTDSQVTDKCSEKEVNGCQLTIFYKFHREARLSKTRVCRSRSFLCASSQINISRITRRKRFLFWLLMMGIHPFPSRLPSKSVIKSTSSASFRRKVSALHGKNWKIHCHIKIIKRRRRRRRAVKGETKKWKKLTTVDKAKDGRLRTTKNL